MRKGYTILEMLGVIFIMGILMVVTARPFRNISFEIPHMNKDFNVDASLCDAVEKIRADVESADSVISYPGNESVLGHSLLINTSKGAVLYYTADDEVIRQKQLNGTEETWKIPKGRLRWNLWYDEVENNVEAVVVTHAVARKIAGKIRERLVNTHVYFVGSAEEEGGKL